MKLEEPKQKKVKLDTVQQTFLEEVKKSPEENKSPSVITTTISLKREADLPFFQVDENGFLVDDDDHCDEEDKPLKKSAKASRTSR